MARPRHERGIVLSSPVAALPKQALQVALAGPILSVCQIEENRVGNVLLIIVNGFFTLTALASAPR
jgi:hypothetical protein